MSKVHCSYNIEKEVIEKMESCYRQANCRTKSDFVERAIEFYCGYTTAENYSEYLPSVVLSSTKAMLDNFENHMSSLLFKIAVELSMNLHLSASYIDNIDDYEIRQLRNECADEVRRIHGQVSFDEVWKKHKK